MTHERQLRQDKNRFGDYEGLTGVLAESGAEIALRTEAARGHRPADIVLKGARVLLATGEIVPRDIAVSGSRIATVAPDIVAPGNDSVDLTGKFVVPGYFEPHTHTFGPLSLGSYCGQVLSHGTSCVVSDDAFVYGFLDVAQYHAMLDAAASLPMILRWSLRLEPPRTIPLSVVAHSIDRPDVAQIGEVMTRQVIDKLDPEVFEMIASARGRMVKIEGHAPGASVDTLGASSAAGATADHEAVYGEQAVERLRAGLWTFLRHTESLEHVPGMVAHLLEAGVSLERTGFNTDWSLPPWLDARGGIDAALSAALGAGMTPAEAYATGSRRPATYYGLDGHFGLIAPGRLASFNVLEDLDQPRPLRVFSAGIEAARDGQLLIDIPEIPWDRIGAPRWSRHAKGPDHSFYESHPEDPEMHLTATSLVRPGSGDGTGRPSICISIDPDRETLTRARIHGFPDDLRGIASTLTPRRLLVGIGSNASDLGAVVDAVVAQGGGIGYWAGHEIRILALPVGGVITPAPYDEVLEFWSELESYFEHLGHAVRSPISTLLYIGADSLPGARFSARGLVDTKRDAVMQAAKPITWR